MPKGSVRVSGQRIRALRKEMLLAQHELAKIVGISPNSLYQIEMRRQTTMPTTLKRIAKALKVKPSELVNLEEEEGNQGDRAARVQAAGLVAHPL